MVIKVLLIADGQDTATTTASTTVDVGTTDPRWPAWLVEAVTFQAREAARRLRDELIAQLPLRDETPLAAIVPGAEAGR